MRYSIEHWTMQSMVQQLNNASKILNSIQKEKQRGVEGGGGEDKGKREKDDNHRFCKVLLWPQLLD